MKLVKGLFLVLGIAGLFSTYQFDAMAKDYEDCNNAYKGKYCKTKGSHKYCPQGCYCPGESSGKKAAGDLTVTTYCGDKNKYASVKGKLAEYGINYCPDDFPYTAERGAEEISKCYRKKNENGGDGSGNRLYYKKSKSYAGGYLKKNTGSNSPCEKNYWCPGGEWYPNPNKDQGIYACPSEYPYSTSGAKSITDCYGVVKDAAGNITGNTHLSDATVVCAKGKYFEADTQACKECPSSAIDGKYYVCPNETTVNVPKYEDTGLVQCTNGKVPNKDRTVCVLVVSAMATTAKVPQQIQHTDLQVESVTSNGGGSYELPDDFQPQDYNDTPIGPVNTASQEDVGVVTQGDEDENGNGTTTGNETGGTTNSEEDGDDTNENNVVNIVHVDEGMYLPAGSLNPSYCTSANAPVYSNQFCPGGDFYQNQYYDQGIYNCLNGGTANAAHTSCRVLLDTGDLMYGVSGQGECWMIENDADEYRSCVFGGAYDVSMQ